MAEGLVVHLLSGGITQKLAARFVGFLILMRFQFSAAYFGLEFPCLLPVLRGSSWTVFLCVINWTVSKVYTFYLKLWSPVCSLHVSLNSVTELHKQTIEQSFNRLLIVWKLNMKHYNNST